MIDASSFMSTPVASDAGHARTFEETEAWVLPLVRRVPITRVVDVSPLDVLNLPCWAAITPLAKDLTTHAGKGLTSRAARLSAVMEAIERVCAEQIPAGTVVRRASYRELVDGGETGVLDPEECGLPFASSYAPDRTFSWMPAFDLQENDRTWVPIDLVVSPPTEGMRIGQHTNGLAAGNTVTEATLHAVCEVIERDALAHHEFCDAFAEASDEDSLPPRPIDPTTLPADALAWHRCINGAGMQLIVSELRNASEVPAYAASIIDSIYPSLDGPTEMVFGGWGCDLDADRAVLRAITEAVQCRMISIQGARDSSEGGQSIERTWSLRRAMAVRTPTSRYPFGAQQSRSSGDLFWDLKDVCRRMRAAGYRHCIVADLTRVDLQVPVVRVVVPGMASPLRYGLRPPWRQLARLV